MPRKVTRGGQTTIEPGISYVPPANLSKSQRALIMLRESTGLNVRLAPSGGVQKAITKEEFFKK
ncbi:hypothetical protein FEM03_23475 [Phragmitibacter flavus]|uniref:Uncharacterized protein n=1 Tax=Phragmitibacter flavus TaxID=2576071 RepID=A0A5R8K7F5_9BACT|nr:hypothetical protein [Phragmitibacter flavus]TLD68283.1 hypothetical protein FEM03_23475 [Phragmitibacter flavus]